MATLRIHMPGTGVKVYHIYKKLTSLGRAKGSTSFSLIPCWRIPTRTSTLMAATS